MEVVGGIKIGGSLLRYMCDCSSLEYFTGRLQILVGNVMEKALVPISSTLQPSAKSSDVLLLHDFKGKGSKRSNNDNQDLWTSVSDGDTLKDFPGEDVGDGIQEICATPIQ
eukprot:8132345-Ditylum_brightwellii.AAC.1